MDDLKLFTLAEIFLYKKFTTVFIEPRNNMNKICHKTWNQAFDDCRIATHYVLVWSYFCIVNLVDNWTNVKKNLKKHETQKFFF